MAASHTAVLLNASHRMSTTRISDLLQTVPPSITSDSKHFTVAFPEASRRSMTISFLDLPQNVRFDIYRLAAPSDCPITGSWIDLNSKSAWPPRHDCGMKSFPEKIYHSHESRKRDALVYKLLLTSRQINADVSELFFGGNGFFVRYTPSEGLSPLATLRPSLLSHLKHLVIFLQDSILLTREHRSCLCLQCREWSLRPLCRSDMSRIWEWQQVARNLAKYITPNALYLGLTCETSDYELAEEVVKPLLDGSLQLARCDIRLSTEPDRELRNLAKKASLRATGQDTAQPKGAFRFMDLPKEIRLQILSHTDLVTPYGDVEWNPQRGLHLHHGHLRMYNIYQPFLKFPRYPLDEPELNIPDRCTSAVYHGCYCMRSHGAYTSKCSCWAPPTSMFLPSRQFRQDALEVFFKRNKIVVTPADKCAQPAPKSTAQPLHILTFLQNFMPSDALRYIQYLQIVFPPFRSGYLEPDAQTGAEWLASIEFMARYLNLPALTLDIHVATWLLCHSDVDEEFREYRRNITQAQGQEMEQSYYRVFTPLSALNGALKEFFIHLEYPWTYVMASSAAWATDRVTEEKSTHFERRETDIEQDLRRRVLGPKYRPPAEEKGKRLREVGWALDELDNNHIYWI